MATTLGDRHQSYQVYDRVLIKNWITLVPVTESGTRESGMEEFMSKCTNLNDTKLEIDETELNNKKNRKDDC